MKAACTCNCNIYCNFLLQTSWDFSTINTFSRVIYTRLLPILQFHSITLGSTRIPLSASLSLQASHPFPSLHPACYIYASRPTLLMALKVRQGNELTGFSFSSPSSSSSRNRPLVTLELFDLNSASFPAVELDQGSALPLGWHGFLDLEGGCLYYKHNQSCTMNRKDKQQGTNGKLDLKLNLSPPKNGNGGGDNNSPSSPSSYFSSSSSGTSPPSSCISSELSLENRAGSEADQGQTLRYSNSPEATSMVLVGCPRCLMYVMLSEDDPKCPKCKSTCLLDFHQDGSKKTRNF